MAVISEAEGRLSSALFRVCAERPYLGAALWTVRRVAVPGLKTMAVDAGWRMFYDPETVLVWSIEELASVVYHEVAHLLRDHASRSEGRPNPQRWNIACDAEINDDLLAENGPLSNLPGVPITPQMYDLPVGLLAEEYYERLPEKPSSPVGGGAGACGGCVRGDSGDALDERTAETESLSAVEASFVRRVVARDIESMKSLGRGVVPSHWTRWAQRELSPKIDWRRELAASVRRAIAEAMGLVDYTYARPSRRQGVAGTVVLPSLRRPVPKIAVVVDTSGSMETEALEQALAETKAILAAVGTRDGIAVLAVDAAVQTSQRVFRIGAIRLEGGGGTDMGVGLEAAAGLRPRPDVVVVITDGYTPWPTAPPRGVRVVVVLVGSGGPSGPEWARCVRIEAES